MFSHSFVLPAGVSRWWDAVASVADTGRGARPALASVFVEMGHVWSPLVGEVDGISLTATDSYRLLNVVIPAPAGNVEHYVDGIDGPVYAQGGSVMLPATIKVGGRSVLRADWYSSDITDAYSRSYQVGQEVKVTTKTGTSIVEAVPAEFPNWRSLMPDAGKVNRCEAFGMHAARLGSMLTAVGKVCGDTPVRFVATSELGPNRFDVVVGDTPEERTVYVSGIIMPMRVIGGVTGHLEANAGVLA